VGATAAMVVGMQACDETRIAHMLLLCLVKSALLQVWLDEGWVGGWQAGLQQQLWSLGCRCVR
jgi:hypothetical protein